MYYLNLTGIQGNTLIVNAQLTDYNGNYINLSGYSLSGYAKEKYSSTGKLLNLTVSMISAASGYISISGSANSLSSVPVGIYPFALEAQISDYIFKPLIGYLHIFPDVMNL